MDHNDDYSQRGGQDAGFANDLSTAGATPSSRLRRIVGWDRDYWLDRGTALGVHRLFDAERSIGRRMGRAHRARATSGEEPSRAGPVHRIDGSALARSG